LEGSWVRLIVGHESCENAVTFSMMLQIIENGQGMCSSIRRSLGSSRETSLGQQAIRGPASQVYASQAILPGKLLGW
jgi:hypothetical protein